MDLTIIERLMQIMNQNNILHVEADGIKIVARSAAPKLKLTAKEILDQHETPIAIPKNLEEDPHYQAYVRGELNLYKE